jgi:WD40 repeat protein
MVSCYQRNIAEEQARIALSRELAAGAAHSSDKELKVLLAREAVSVTYSADKSVTAEAAEILRTSAPPEPITLSVGHIQPITALMFSPDGKRLVTANEEAVKIWNAASGDELRSVSSLAKDSFGDYGKLIGVAFSGDGERLVWCSTLDAKIWDSLSGRELFAEPPIPGPITGFAFSQDGMRLAISRNGELRFWDPLSRQQLWVVSSDQYTNQSKPVFSPDGTILAVPRMAAVQLLDASTGKERVSLTNHMGSVGRVAFSPNGKRLATISGENNETVKVWDIAELPSPHELPSLPNKSETVTHIVFSPDSNRLAWASEKRTHVQSSHTGAWHDEYAGHSTVKVWDILSNTEAFVLPDQTKAITCLTFSTDGTRLATADDAEIHLCDAVTGQGSQTLPGRNFVAFSRDGHIASPGEGAQAKVWDLTSGSELFILPGQTDLKLGGGAFSPDRQRLATKGFDGKVRVWDVKTGQLLSTVHSGPVDAIAFSPDGKRLGISSLGVRGAVTLFDAVTGGKSQTLKGNGRILSIAFNPGGTKVAAGSNEDNARLWDATSGHELRTLNSKSVCGIAFSPDGTRVATVNLGGEGMLWETSSGRSLLSLSDYRSSGFGLLFSPDGTRLATEQQIWDSASGRQLFALGQPGSSGGVGTVHIAFSPDGKLFATGGDKAKLWDASSGKELLTFEDSANVSCVAFSMDGKYLATVCADWTVRLHPIRIEELMALAHKQVARELSVEEREKYLHTKSGKMSY